MLGTTFRVINSKVQVIVVRNIIVKRLTIDNLFSIMFRTTITLTFEFITLNAGEVEVLYCKNNVNLEENS